MGEGGSGMTVAAGDVVIMSDNLLRITSTISFCRYSKSIIIQNCAFAVVVKIMAVILAIIGLLNLWNAVLIDLGTLLVVIANGIRPLNSKVFNDSNLDIINKLQTEEYVEVKQIDVENKI